MKLYSKMYADILDLPCILKIRLVGRLKLRSKGDVSVADNGQKYAITVIFYIYMSHLCQHKGNLSYILIHFWTGFSPFYT